MPLHCHGCCQSLYVPACAGGTKKHCHEESPASRSRGDVDLSSAETLTLGNPSAALDDTEGPPGAAGAVGACVADGRACRTGPDEWGHCLLSNRHDDELYEEEDEEGGRDQARAVAAEAAASAAAAAAGEQAEGPKATVAAPDTQQQPAAPGKPAASYGQYTRMMNGSGAEIEFDGTKIVLYESVRLALVQTLLQSGTLFDRDEKALVLMLKQGDLATVNDSTGGYTVNISKVIYEFSKNAADEWGRLYPTTQACLTQTGRSVRNTLCVDNGLLGVDLVAAYQSIWDAVCQHYGVDSGSVLAGFLDDRGASTQKVMAELGETDAGAAKALFLKAFNFGGVGNSQIMATFKEQMLSAVMKLKRLPDFAPAWASAQKSATKKHSECSEHGDGDALPPLENVEGKFVARVCMSFERLIVTRLMQLMLDKGIVPATYEFDGANHLRGLFRQ